MAAGFVAGPVQSSAVEVMGHNFRENLSFLIYSIYYVPNFVGSETKSKLLYIILKPSFYETGANSIPIKSNLNQKYY